VQLRRAGNVAFPGQAPSAEPAQKQLLGKPQTKRTLVDAVEKHAIRRSYGPPLLILLGGRPIRETPNSTQLTSNSSIVVSTGFWDILGFFSRRVSESDILAGTFGRGGWQGAWQ
jgi:hypothetical protein